MTRFTFSFLKKLYIRGYIYFFSPVFVRDIKGHIACIVLFGALYHIYCGTSLILCKGIVIEELSGHHLEELPGYAKI